MFINKVLAMLASPSSYSSLHHRSINTDVVRARNSDFPESQQTEKMVDQCPKRPSYSGWNSDFFYRFISGKQQIHLRQLQLILLSLRKKEITGKIVGMKILKERF